MTCPGYTTNAAKGPEDCENIYDQLAAELLIRGLNATKETFWEKCNQQRLALLHKSSTHALTPEESEQLRRLQSLADQRREALDAESSISVAFIACGENDGTVSAKRPSAWSISGRKQRRLN